MTRTLTALILSLACAACSTPSGAAFGDYDPIPAGRARLYVYRPSNWRTALQRLHVTLDDRLLTRLANGGYVSVDLRPGRYQLAMGFAKLFLVEWVDAERPLSLHSGSAMFCEFTTEYRLIGHRDQPLLECSDDPVAHPDLWRCSRDDVAQDPGWKP